MTVSWDRERFEVTRNGMFGGPVDTVRRFAYGPWEATVELEDGRRFLIPHEHHDALAGFEGEGDEAALVAFVVEHGVPLR